MQTADASKIKKFENVTSYLNSSFVKNSHLREPLKDRVPLWNSFQSCLIFQSLMVFGFFPGNALFL